MRVAFYNGVKLHDSKAECFCLFDAVLHKFFADMLPATGFSDREAGVADPAQPSRVIGMENVSSNDLAVCVFCDSGVGLC